MRYDSINMHQVRVISHCISLSDQSQSEASPLGYFSIHACESSYTYVNAAYVEAYLLSTFKPLLLNDYLSHVASEAGGDLCVKGASSLQVRPATLLFLATVRHSLFSQKRNLGNMYWGKRFSHISSAHVLLKIGQV